VRSRLITSTDGRAPPRRPPGNTSADRVRCVARWARRTPSSTYTSAELRQIRGRRPVRFCLLPPGRSGGFSISSTLPVCSPSSRFPRPRNPRLGRHRTSTPSQLLTARDGALSETLRIELAFGRAQMRAAHDLSARGRAVIRIVGQRGGDARFPFLRSSVIERDVESATQTRPAVPRVLLEIPPADEPIYHRRLPIRRVGSNHELTRSTRRFE